MKRIFFLIMTLVFLHGCAAGVAAGYGQGGRDGDGRSYQEAQADNNITAAVNTALVREGIDLDVHTYAGVVTVAGRVANRAEAQRALETARRVPGVRAVRDELRIVR